MQEKKQFQKASALSILSANCINHHSPLADCNICTTVCPQKALSFQDGVFTAVNCNLCGICAMVCPTQVFQIDLPYLLNPSEQTLILCCSQNASAPAEALRINCIQQLNPLAIIHLLYRYSSVTIYLPVEHCKQCAHQWYAQGLIQQLDTYQIPSEKLQIVTETVQISENENQRRELFRDILHRTEDGTKKIMTNAIEKISAEFSSKEIAQKEPAIFPARLPLYALYVKKELPVPEEQELPFRQLKCDTCTFCGACMHICPTQAIEITNIDEEKHLLFHPELCINCNLCHKICLQHGLIWGDFFTAEQFLHSPILLAHSPEYLCTLCEHEFYQWPSKSLDEDAICSFCR